LSGAERLAAVIAREAPRLAGLDEAGVSAPRGSGWSRKQILGHLIDSASNNHQRIVRTLVAGRAEFPSYAQESWVAAQSYATEPWPGLVELWVAINRHLLHIIGAMSSQQLEMECEVGGGAPMPLERIVEGYLDHMEHHLATI